MRYYLISLIFHFSILFGALLFSASEKRTPVAPNEHVFVEMITLPQSPAEGDSDNRAKKTVLRKIKEKVKSPKKHISKKVSKISASLSRERSNQSGSHKDEVESGGNAKVNLSYAQELKLFLEKNKHYPRQALRLKQSGVVVVNLNIDATGKFLNIKIEKPSSFPILNNAAEELLRKLGRFKPLPNSLASGSNFTIPIAYISRRM